MTNNEMLKSIIDRLDRIEVIMMAFMRSINNDLENMKGRWDELEPEIIKAINWWERPLTSPVYGPEKLNDGWVPPVGPTCQDQK